MKKFKIQYEQRGMQTWHEEIIEGSNIIEAIGKFLALNISDQIICVMGIDCNLWDEVDILL